MGIIHDALMNNFSKLLTLPLDSIKSAQIMMLTCPSFKILESASSEDTERLMAGRSRVYLDFL